MHADFERSVMINLDPPKIVPPPPPVQIFRNMWTPPELIFQKCTEIFRPPLKYKDPRPQIAQFPEYKLNTRFGPTPHTHTQVGLTMTKENDTLYMYTVRFLSLLNEGVYVAVLQNVLDSEFQYSVFFLNCFHSSSSRYTSDDSLVFL